MQGTRWYYWATDL